MVSIGKYCMSMEPNVILSVNVLIKLITLILLSLIIISCNYSNKFVEYDDISADLNQVVIFKNGWGLDYDYPIILDLSNEIKEENNEIVIQIQNAAETWNNAIGKKILMIRTGLNPYTGNSFPGLYAPFQVFYKGIYFDKISDGQGGWVNNTGKGSSTIATTVYNYKSVDRIDSVNLRFNRDTYIFGDSTKEINRELQFIADMESIALHELGHILGLGHAFFERNSVMYPFIAVGPNSQFFPTTARCLSAKDVERVREIYPGGQEPILNCISN